MDDRPALTLEEQFAAAQAWWHEAGVDWLFHDEPAPWLAREAEAAAPEIPAPQTALQQTGAPRTARAASLEPHLLVGADRSAWPGDLLAFRDWWLSEPGLDTGGGFSRVPPRGKAGAELMVIVPEPEAEDRDALLSGGQGRLVANMLSAMGIAEENAYLTAALPRHTPLPDWTGLAVSGLGAVLCHHVGLVRPRRLLVLGGNILPLLGHDPTQAPALIRETSLHSGPIPTLCARDPGYLLRRPDARATLWRRWLDWIPDAREKP